MIFFHENVDFLNLIDIKPSNGIFTWNNRHCGDEAISERLDRFLVSFFWIGGNLSTTSAIIDNRGSNY